MCNNNDIEDEYHFILECSKYVEIRRKYIKPYYCINSSAYKLTQLLSVQNIKELNNLAIILYSKSNTAYRYINTNYKQYMIHYTQYIII
jgi:hypothetical protein